MANLLQENMLPRKVARLKYLMNLWRAKTLIVHFCPHMLYHAGTLYLNPKRGLLKSE
jgi:hypothetical protein